MVCKKNPIHLQSHRGMEQLVARWAHNPKVAGSSPAPATKFQTLFTLRREGFAFCGFFKSVFRANE